MAYSLAQLAQLVDGALHGDGELMIAGAAILRDAQPGEITYCLGPEHAKGLEASAASAVLLPPGMSGCGMPFVTVEDVAEAFTRVVYHFRPPRLRRNVGISPAAHVSRQAKIAPDVQIHPLATVGDDVTIGPRCVIHAGVHIMASILI